MAAIDHSLTVYPLDHVEQQHADNSGSGDQVLCFNERLMYCMCCMGTGLQYNTVS